MSTLLDQGRDIVKTWAKEIAEPEANRIDVKTEPVDLVAVVTALHNNQWGYLAAITGLDAGTSLEVLYHFCNGPEIITLRVLIPRESASIPSVCGVIPSASFLERELGEMLGVTVVGTPDTTRLFLPDECHENTYPLRKDAVLPHRT